MSSASPRSSPLAREKDVIGVDKSEKDFGAEEEEEDEEEDDDDDEDDDEEEEEDE